MKFFRAILFVFFFCALLFSCEQEGNIRVYIYPVPRRNLNACVNELFKKKVLIKDLRDSDKYDDKIDGSCLYHVTSFVSGRDTLHFEYTIQKATYLTDDYKSRISEYSTWFAILYYAKNHDDLKEPKQLSWFEKRYFLKQLENLVIPALDSCVGQHEIKPFYM